MCDICDAFNNLALTMYRTRSSETYKVHYGRPGSKPRKKAKTQPPTENEPPSKKKTSLIPSEVLLALGGKYWSIKWVCTHGWDSKRRRGTGATVTQQWRATGCEAGFWVRAIPPNTESGGTWTLKTSKVCTSHNHNVNNTIWRAYVDNRRISDDSLVQEVTKLRSVGGQLRKIVQHLRTLTGTQITASYISNLLYRKRKDRERVEGNVHVRTHTVVNEFVEKPGNVVRVFVNERNVASVITFQSARQRRMYKTNPHMIMADGTHGTWSIRDALIQLTIISLC
jgi:hypothetical protein